MRRCLAAAFSFGLILFSATSASGGQGQADGQSSVSDSASLDRIRAGVERKTSLADGLADTQVPTFRIEVTQPMIKLRPYWSDKDPDMQPDPFMYPVPSAAELLINTVILKPKAALRARKQRAIRKQIQSEIQQIEQQQREAASSPSPTPPPPK